MSRAPDDRTVNDMIRDQIVIDRIESWGEWDFLAREVPVERDDLEDSYDVITFDMENRRVQADVIGYDRTVERHVHQAVDLLENDYGYIVPHLTSDDFFETDFPPPQVEGDIFWAENDEWKLRTSEFENLSDSLFGYDIFSRGYEKVDADSIR